ncbi:hypothetical protein K402DRAFT_184059 [Aulographum hederae CBS 113979]|uniref:Uncharacterized protein n=1 Tax=Aulographum hederae CBS 113979 TaxID=1176131 RepID=A0A6G1GPQ0_9PEZI|nr:hypothetical protein K402DRAFT_184059 [Aulographum hederae CBS 113979]
MVKYTREERGSYSSVICCPMSSSTHCPRARGKIPIFLRRRLKFLTVGYPESAKFPKSILDYSRMYLKQSHRIQSCYTCQLGKALTLRLNQHVCRPVFQVQPHRSNSLHPPTRANTRVDVVRLRRRDQNRTSTIPSSSSKFNLTDRTYFNRLHVQIHV